MKVWISPDRHRRDSAKKPWKHSKIVDARNLLQHRYGRAQAEKARLENECGVALWTPWYLLSNGIGKWT